MKLVVVVPTLDFGYRYMDELFQALDRASLAPTVLTTSKLDGERFLGPRIRHVRLRFRTSEGQYDRLIVLTSPQLIWQVWRSNPDVVLVVEYSLASFWSILGARLAGAKVVIFQEHVVETSRLRDAWRQLLRRLSDHVVANTSTAFTSLQSGLAKGKVTEIPLLVPPVVQPPTDTMATFPHVPSATKFLFVGSLDERKNIGTLLSAASLLASETRDFHLLIVGTGHLERDLRDQSNFGDLESYVTFAGQVAYEQIGEYYRWCDVFIMPTLQDYRSVAVLEALRYGKPVIDSVEDGNAGDSVVDGRNGRLVNPRDPRAIAKAMYELISDPERVRKMGRESSAYMAERTPEIVALHFRTLVESLLQEASRIGPLFGK